MKEGWTYKKFEDALHKVKYTKKLQSSDYLQEGIVPVISQEDDYISGYWNNVDDAFKVESPLVIFGDHSRVVKYVDFDFVLGADGVKILQPKDFLEARFLYHYLRWYNVPSLGYSRHYKLLKEINLPIPPLTEQERIVSELDLLSSIIEKKKAQLEEYDQLAQSIFYDMFGDPVTNEKGWEVKKLSDVCQKITDGTHNSPVNTDVGDYMYVTAKNIKKEGVNTDNITYVSTEVHNAIYERCNPQYGDVLYIKDGATTGIAAINTIKEEFSLLSSVALLKPNDIIINYYLKEVLNMPSKYSSIRENMGGAAITRLTIAKINQIRIPLPPLSLQQQFAEKIEAIEKQKEQIKQSITEVETLFNSRMDYYFN